MGAYNGIHMDRGRGTPTSQTFTKPARARPNHTQHGVVAIWVGNTEKRVEKNNVNMHALVSAGGCDILGNTEKRT